MGNLDRITGCLVLLALAFSVALTTVPAAAESGNGGITLNFKKVELATLIDTISELTGKNFVYDDSVRGKVTIISSHEMSREEAYHLFLTVLNIKGYTVVPSGSVNKIVAIKNAKESAIPAAAAGDSDQFITRMITLKHVNASDIASSILSPLIPRTSNIAVYQPSNTLILTDSAANISRLVQIIRKLDVPGAIRQLRLIPLKFANATDVAAMCEEIVNGKKERAVAVAPRVLNVNSTVVPTRIIPYERTNCLIVMATSAKLATIMAVVEKLDKKTTSTQSRINLYYLENADAETLAKTLNRMISGSDDGGKKARNGQRPIAALHTDVSITADKPTNALIVNATPEDYLIIKDIIKQLDIRRKQVYVEALIMELSMDATEQLGVSLQGGFEVGDEGVVAISTNKPVGIVGPDLLSKSVKGLLAGGFSKLIEYTNSDGEIVRIPAFSALIQLSKGSSDINILSAPRLLTSDNEEAEIVVGRNVPIITSRLNDPGGSSGITQSVAVERKDVALTLRFTPQIAEGDYVRLKVYQETTDLVPDALSVGDVNDVGPTFTTRKISNTVMAKDGQTVVLGGLISTHSVNKETKVPFLGDIPVLGWLFKTSEVVDQKTNLLIFITPRIIKDAKLLNEITLGNRREMDAIQAQQRGAATDSDNSGDSGE